VGTAVDSAIDPWFVNTALLPAELRLDIGALLGRSSSNLMAAETGILPGGGDPAACTQNQSVPPRVSLAPFYASMNTSAGGPYLGCWNATQNVVFTTAAGNPRIDLLCARVLDTDVDASGSKKFQVLTVDGTPAASPSRPSVPAGYLELWECRVATNGTITFTDRRTYSRAVGGIRYAPPHDLARAGSYTGDLRIQSSGQIDVWLGSSWTQILSPAGWNSYTPVLTSPGGTLSLGSGGVATGRYALNGKKLDLSLTFQFGTGGDGKYGAITTTLPPGLVHRTGTEEHLPCFLFTTDTGPNSWQGMAYFPPNSNVIWPRFSDSLSDCRIDYWVIATSAGAPGTGRPFVPSGYPAGAGCIFSLSGSVEVQ
jgi:hypothetical protein